MDMAGPSPDLAPESQTNARNNQIQAPFIDDFFQIGQQIFYYEPQQQSRDSLSPDSQPPDLIIICSWLYAHLRHIAKYTISYQRLYPASPILLLKQDGPDITWRPNSWALSYMKPAVSVIRDLEAKKSGRLQVLMHSFSNGGAFTACQLAEAYALDAGTSEKAPLLPISALVIDSAPSIPSLSSGFVAMSQGMPQSLPAPVRLVGGLVAYTSMVTLSMASRLLGGEGVITRVRRELNEKTCAFMRADVSRVYIYSESDELVPYQHVEAHAREAKSVFNDISEELGEKMVRLEKFNGSKHVAHMVVDAQRYWDVVQTLWACVNLKSS